MIPVHPHAEKTKRSLLFDDKNFSQFYILPSKVNTKLKNTHTIYFF